MPTLFDDLIRFTGNGNGEKTTHVDPDLVMESDHDLDRDVGPSNAESSSSPSNRSKQFQDLSDIDM